MLVTSDEYELPIMVCSSASELAKKLGIKTDTIYREITLKRNGKVKKTKYVKVILED